MWFTVNESTRETDGELKPKYYGDFIANRQLHTDKGSIGDKLLTPGTVSEILPL